MLFDENGRQVFQPGKFRLTAGSCSPGARGTALGWRNRSALRLKFCNLLSRSDTSIARLIIGGLGVATDGKTYPNLIGGEWKISNGSTLENHNPADHQRNYRAIPNGNPGRHKDRH